MLNGAREYAPAFTPDQIGWIDFETRSDVDISDVGAMVYANHPTTTATVVAFAIGDGPTQVVALDRFGPTLDWADMPIELLRHHAKVMNGTAVWCAWNAGFDRAVWNYTCAGFPELEPHMIIDAMAQAVANGLPPDLSMAAKLSHSTHKVEEGKDLIKRFCVITPSPKARILPGTPQTHPEEWTRFKAYAAGDILAMRSVFHGTRQLPLWEWQEYWAGERVNDRGIMIDVPMARAAARIASEDRSHSGTELQKLTRGAVQTVGQVNAIMDWLLGELPPEGRNIVVSREVELDEEGEMVRPAKRSLKRNRLEKLLAYCLDRLGKADKFEADEYDWRKIIRVLEIRRFGGSTTPAKFQKMLDQQHDGALYGSYVFNGAAQTGRYSSRGVQIHNLTRDALPYEPDAIEALLADDASHASFSRLNFGAEPVSRKLSLLVRPTLIARPGKAFIWSDWANIEARVLPWLAGDHPGARERLDIFRAVDADPKVPDLYTRTAAKLSRIPIEQVTKPIRQRGKVAELALGFGGGVGALQAMGAGYGLYFSDTDARTVVDAWRYENQWCVQFWGKHNGNESYGLWGAACTALNNPHHITTAGRIRFMYVPELMKSLLMILPSGRFLTYRDIRFESVADLDDDDNIVGYSTKLRFHKGYGRSVIWHGTFCENAVQATAADILRGTLVRLDDEGMGATAHTHDEVLLEVPEADAELAEGLLRDTMRQGFTWSAGLPIMSEEETGFYYSKWEAK
jgi:DNA polymerase